MARTLDMKFIRYLNLFERVTKVRTQHCFFYNFTIVFLVPRSQVARAIGEGGRNIKKLSQILEKKVKIISIPLGKEDMHRFVLDIIYPVRFKNIEVKDNGVLISAGMQSRASLIGRNKRRLNEMREILEQYFGVKEVRIA